MMRRCRLTRLRSRVVEVVSAVAPIALLPADQPLTIWTGRLIEAVLRDEGGRELNGL